MAFPISVTYTFAPMTGTIPLSDLDSNFSTLVNSLNGVSDGTLALVTPNLGTPSSGTLTNCTGYTYANLSGTVPTWNQNTTGTAAGLSATLIATSGGTGQSSYAVGDLLYANSTTTLAKLADVATGNALISGGVGVAPSWGKIGLTTHVSGTLPVGNGGTGATATPTNGQLLIGNGTNFSVASLATTGGIQATTGAGTLSITNIASSGQTANTTVTNTTTYTTAGVTLPSQTMAAGAVWRVRAYGQFTAANSATTRTARIAAYWGATALPAITPTVLINTAQTTQWQVEFTITGSSATAAWVAGSLLNRTASATALAIDNATPASTTGLTTTSTLDLRVSMSTAVAGDSWIIQSVTMERID